MRMGCHSGIQRLIVYAFCFLFLFIGWPKPVTANPALVAGLLVRVIAQTTAKRAATQVVARQAVTKYPLTEAAIQATIRKEAAATVAGMSRVAATRAATVPVNSALRKSGQVTWAALNVVGGVMTASELIDAFRSDNLKVVTDGVSLGNGKYEVRIGGRTQIVDFEPSPDSPVFLYGASFGSELEGTTIQPSRPVSVEAFPLNDAKTGTFPIPSGVIGSTSFDNSFAIYSIDIDDDTGDYHYIDNDNIDAVKNIMILKAVRSFEKRFKPVVYTAKGDNASFEYVHTSYSLDVLEFSPKIGSKFPYYPSMNLETNRIGNAITSFDAVVPAILHKKTLLSSYNPCEYVTVSDSVGDKVVTSDKRICTPPNDNDYVMNDERISDSVRLSLNTNYNGDYFDKKNKPDSIKTVSASELADILKDKPLDNSIIADLINDLLYDAAAQDGYEGITLSDSDYITESEVSDALKTVGGRLTASDLFSPIQDIELPSTSTGTGSGTKVDSDIEVKVDFGSDPNVKLPDLGEPPSGKEIIQPIRDSMPFLSDFKIGGRDAACPVADISFSLAGFNFEQIIDSHCDVIEKNRKFIELIASLIWAFAALRMILSA